jgi:hypothetical protein
MSRPRRGAPSNRPKIQAPRDAIRDAPLDRTAQEAIHLFARALARCGAPPSAIAGAFAEACAAIPRTFIESARRASRELSDASHVLSLWFADPLYLDAAGSPLALPVRGSTPSIATLVARVDPMLDANAALTFLIRIRAVRKIGVRYAPRSRAIDFRGTGAPTYSRGLRMVLALLRTLEHNTKPQSQVPGSFEYSAENPHFPRSAIEHFGAKVRQGGLAWLHELDSAMLSYERNRNPNEPTVRMGVGVYLYEDENELDGRASEPAATRATSRARARRGKNR